MEMELEEWELLSDNNLITSRATEVVAAPIYQEPALEDPDDVLFKERSKEVCVHPPVETLEEKSETPDNEFEEEEELHKEEDTEIEHEFREEVDKEEDLVVEFEKEEETREEGDSLDMKKNDGSSDGFNSGVWKWRVRAGRAVSSVGLAAAATLLMLVLGGRHDRPDRNIQSQSYAEDKRLEQVVQQATRLNQALSSARGAPTTRATISFGGYHHGA